MRLFVVILVLLLLLSVGGLFYVANFLFNGILDRDNDWFEEVAHGLVNSDIETEHGQEIQVREVAQLKQGETVWQEARERYTISSFDDLALHGRVIPSTTPSDKWLLCFHGYRTSGQVDMGYISSELAPLGFNCLVVDQRAHGESEGKYITMGWLERRDVLSWTDFLIKEKNPQEIIWVGDSMGAATVLMASGEEVPSVVHGIIADCGYSSVEDLFHYLLTSSFKVPAWVPIVPFFNLLTKKKLGFSVYEASAEKQLAHNRLPILFIHGDGDTFVPPRMSKVNMAATKGPSELMMVKDAPHFSSVLFDPQQYFAGIRTFLETYSHT